MNIKDSVSRLEKIIRQSTRKNSDNYLNNNKCKNNNKYLKIIIIHETKCR